MLTEKHRSNDFGDTKWAENLHMKYTSHSSLGDSVVFEKKFESIDKSLSILLLLIFISLENETFSQTIAHCTIATAEAQGAAFATGSLIFCSSAWFAASRTVCSGGFLSILLSY